MSVTHINPQIHELENRAIAYARSEFERGKTVGLRDARLHYARGFTDGLIVAFTFVALGAGFVWFVSAALA